MVIARNKGINALLCQQFSQRTVDKVYTALLCGHLAEDEGIVEAAIAKDPARFPRALRPPRQTGAFALSGHRPPVSGARRREGAGVNPGDAHPGDRTDPSAAYSLPAAGLSDPGCDLYGGRELPGTECAPRLMLHASELRFVHPVSHEPMHIQQASPF